MDTQEALSVGEWLLPFPVPSSCSLQGVRRNTMSSCILKSLVSKPVCYLSCSELRDKRPSGPSCLRLRAVDSTLLRY